jgi:3-methyladenine DNA glycosylase AlkD
MTDATASAVQDALAAVASPERAQHSAGYFKTGPGQYGEGDVFLGVTMPATRAVVKKFTDLPLGEVEVLLDSAVHEHRMVAVLLLEAKFKRASRPRFENQGLRRELAEFYLAAVRRGRVNNWDLVDASAPTMLGGFLLDRPRDVLFELAQSDDLWQRRVAIIATAGFITAGDPSTTLEIAELLLPDRVDLIQKAVGWMLREVGKRVDRAVLLEFLEEHAAQMGRTALSYATEHVATEERARFRAMR